MINEIKKAIMTIAAESHAGLVIDTFEKLDKIESKIKKQDLERRISDIEVHFHNSISMLSVLQNNFTGQCDQLNDQIMYYAIEGIRNELKTCHKKLTKDTIHGGYEGDYPMII